MKTAYISVCDKTGIVELVDGLIQAGFQIYSTGSTLKRLRQAELIVEDIPDTPPSCESVIKVLTLDINDLSGRKELEKLKITRPDVVVANLYPLSQILQQTNFGVEELPQYLDVWASAVLRAASRSFPNTVVLCDPMDYDSILEALTEFGEVSQDRKRRLAAKAYFYCAYYDSTIAQYLSDRPDMLPDEFVMGLKKIEDLPCGENHHQEAAIYSLSGARPWGVTGARLLHGKALAFNHYLDIDTAWELVSEFNDPACCIVKHSNPSGAACSQNLSEAFTSAFHGDPQGAQGAIAAFNRPVDSKTAQAMTDEFIECVIAPEFKKDAMRTLKLKKDIRVVAMTSSLLSAKEIQMYSVSGGVLIENKDNQTLPHEIKPVSKRAPSEMEMRAMKLAWNVAKHSKSYAMVLVHGSQTVGIGSGQPSRMDSLKTAIGKANKKHPILKAAQPLVLAADCPLPLGCVHEAAKAGVVAIIQPGGARQDSDCISACDQKNIALIFSDIRHLKH